LKAGRRAKTLVSQLVAFSRRQVLEMSELSLNDTINDLAKILRHMIGSHVELQISPGAEHDTIRADQGQVERILINLCLNARDAMPDGGKVTIETRDVQIDADFCQVNVWAQPGRYVLLSVTDTGCGMEEETLRKVFEPFFTTKGVGEGTGLGLSTVYGLIRQHNGLIHVESQVGRGTTVKIYLPQVEALPAAEFEVDDGLAPRGNEVILLAEDEPSVRDLALRVLQRAGYVVHVAEDGLEAVQAFERHAESIALSVLDLVMPKLSGIGAYERIREIQPGARVLFSSGYSSNQTQVELALEQGMELLPKPYTPDTLLCKVRELLDAE
jgi:CheY-like chemotaxis protein